MARRRTDRGQEAGASPTETHRASDRIRDGDLRAATTRLAHARLLFLRIWQVFFEKLQPLRTGAGPHDVWPLRSRARQPFRVSLCLEPGRGVWSRPFLIQSKAACRNSLYLTDVCKLGGAIWATCES